MNMNPESFTTYKSLSPVLRTQTTPDTSDNLFINLAIDGGAKTIISGDSHLLKLKEFKGIEIIKVADFLKKK
jgi:predicted nucleic acid-binding protein